MKHRVTEQHHHPKHRRLVVDLRSKSRFYQARTFLDGRLLQRSTKTPQLTTAFKIAEEWYKALLREQDATRRQHPVQSVDATTAERFAAYHASLSTKNKKHYAHEKWNAIRGFWGTLRIREVSTKTFHEFYALRRRRDKVSNHTLHKDVVLIRQILKHSAEEGLLDAFPIVPKIGRIPNRPRRWLNHAEWQHLLKISRKRLAEVKGNKRLVEQRQDCHDFMVFMVHSMMRVDEVRSLTFGDCRLDKNDSGDEILICDVRKSKTGPRPGVVCLVGAASVYKRRIGQHAPHELIFPRTTRDAFRALLEAAGLYKDADGRTRNLRSLRATGISFRVLDGNANVVLIANNSGTSLNSINNFYVKYLRGTDDKNALTRIRSRSRVSPDAADRPGLAVRDVSG
jgi:hypothetical protein